MNIDKLVEILAGLKAKYPQQDVSDLLKLMELKILLENRARS